MTNNGGKELVQAARDGYPGTVRRYLNRDVDPNYQDEQGFTALHRAVEGSCLSVIMTLLLSKRIDVNKRNRKKQTALILAARNGDYYAAKALLNKKAKVNYEDKWRCNALDYAERLGHEEIGKDLKAAGARPTGKKRKVPITVFRSPGPKDTAETMLLRCLEDPKVNITERQVRNVICGSKITDLRQFLSANYLLHLLRKIKHPVMEWFCNFNASGDYVLEHVYYKVSEIDLDKVAQFLVGSSATLAEARGLIRRGKAVDVRKFIKIDARIRRQRKQLLSLTNEVLQEILKLDNRLLKVEGMSREAFTKLQQLADNEKQTIKEVTRMRDYLNELHSALQKKEKRDKYIGIARVLISTIPVFGNALGNAVYTSAEIFFGLTTQHLVEISTDLLKGGISIGLGSDLSDSTSVKALADELLLSKLEPKSRNRIEFAVRQSKFRGMENLSKQLQSIDN